MREEVEVWKIKVREVDSRLGVRSFSTSPPIVSPSTIENVASEEAIKPLGNTKKSAVKQEKKKDGNEGFFKFIFNTYC